MILVTEHMKFERGLDPKEAMGIGITDPLKKFQNFYVKFNKKFGFLLHSLIDEDSKDFYIGFPLIHLSDGKFQEVYDKIIEWFEEFSGSDPEPEIRNEVVKTVDISDNDYNSFFFNIDEEL